MRVIWTGIDEGIFDTLQAARAAEHRAIARREVLRKPAPVIVKMRGGRYLLEGAVIVRGSFSWSLNSKDVARERLIGTPVKSPRPIKSDKKPLGRPRVYVGGQI